MDGHGPVTIMAAGITIGTLTWYWSPKMRAA
jgi:hypothetical protein